MLEKKKIRDGQEWLVRIQECRASGLSGREWCRMHSISTKTFYNKVSELRKKPVEQQNPSQFHPGRNRMSSRLNC